MTAIKKQQKLYRLLEIDTCPICGGEMYFPQNIMNFPGSTVFVLACMDDTRTNIRCGQFEIRPVDSETMDDDWICSWLSTPGI